MDSIKISVIIYLCLNIYFYALQWEHKSIRQCTMYFNKFNILFSILIYSIDVLIIIKWTTSIQFYKKGKTNMYHSYRHFLWTFDFILLLQRTDVFASLILKNKPFLSIFLSCSFYFQIALTRHAFWMWPGWTVLMQVRITSV